VTEPNYKINTTNTQVHIMSSSITTQNSQLKEWDFTLFRQKASMRGRRTSTVRILRE
jgi:hypothetical protein